MAVNGVNLKVRAEGGKIRVDVEGVTLRLTLGEVVELVEWLTEAAVDASRETEAGKAPKPH